MKNIWNKLPKKVKRYLLVVLVISIFFIVTKTPGWIVISAMACITVFWFRGIPPSYRNGPSGFGMYDDNNVRIDDHDPLNPDE